MPDHLSSLFDLIEIRAVASGGFISRDPWFSRAEVAGAVKFSAVVAGTARFTASDLAEPLDLLAGDVVIVQDQQWLELSGGRGDFPPEEVVPTTPIPTSISHYPGDNDIVVGGHIDLNPVGRALLREALPPVAHLQLATESLRASVYRLFQEVAVERPGAAFAIRQHAQLVLLEALRTYADQDEIPAGWLRLLTDQRLANAVDLLHGEPGRAWHLTDLARATHLSRTTFVNRFNEVAGMPPLTYLKRWRMMLARRALRDQDVAVGALAFELGYSSESAFSNAFKREVGESPLRYRSRSRSGGAPFNQ